MYNPFSLEGKTILVTGASSGIGEITAIECSKLGATLIITGRNEERLKETFENLEGKERAHQQIVADFSISAEIERVVSLLPVLDGCVNNAGVSNSTLIQFYKEEEINKQYSINVVAPILLTKFLVKKKKMNKHSSIVFTSSIGGVYVSSIGNGIYDTTKAAIASFVRTSALELSTKMIRCNSVHPGMVETPMTMADKLSQEQIDDDIKKYPLKRHGQPKDIAFAIIYLLSDASSWVTGTALKVDGGFSL
jgi:NAD(P)-dependent dehydrogenase (short-subunit alcohol dehydrogenase family)